MLVSGGSSAPQFIAGELYCFGRLVLFSSFFPGPSSMLTFFFSYSSSAVYLACGASFINTRSRYPTRKRGTQFARASALPLWEPLSIYQPILYLCRQKLICCINRHLPFCIMHYHPSVSLRARQLLTSVLLTASPDLMRNTRISWRGWCTRTIKGRRRVLRCQRRRRGADDDEQGKEPSAIHPAASAL